MQLKNALIAYIFRPFTFLLLIHCVLCTKTYSYAGQHISRSYINDFSQRNEGYSEEPKGYFIQDDMKYVSHRILGKNEDFNLKNSAPEINSTSINNDKSHMITQKDYLSDINDMQRPIKRFKHHMQLLRDDAVIPKENFSRRRRRIPFQRRLFKKLKGKRIGDIRYGSKSRAATESNNSFYDGIPSHRNKRAVTVKKEQLWEYGVIPYEIDGNFSSSHKALFKRAMRHWENYTCIQFVERDSKIHPNYIFFTVRDCGCCSPVGKQNGAQAISIGRNCEKFGIVVHELGHVIGFWHEHTRSDRDKHIIINKQNILKGQEYNFNVLSAKEVDSLGLPYDYNSIMHYAKNTFAKNEYLETIQPIGKTDDTNIVMGQRVHLSAGDITQANILYKCTKCGQTFQQYSGQITSPHYHLNSSRYNGHEVDENYIEDDGSGDDAPDNTQDFDKSLEICEWRITATNGERIMLQIHELNLLESMNCTDDYLEIRDGYWQNSPILKRACGNSTAISVKAISSRMLIRYVNHNAIKGFRGFVANFEIVCGGDIFLTKEHRIESPNYPLQYMPDKECIWRITAPTRYQVAVHFQIFDLEKHDHCIHDYVEIRDGNSSDSDLIGRFCGYKLPLNQTTTSNQMYVRFISDATVQKIGFSAIFMIEEDECKFGNHGCQHQCINTLGSYQCRCFKGYELQVDGKQCQGSCSRIIDASIPNGTLYSPSYPDLYPTSKECVWELVAPNNYAVFLTFTHFDLEGTRYQYTKCNYDYLVAYSKLKDSRLKKIGVFCGNETPPVLNSEQNILRLEFFSDDSVRHTGFVARFQIDNNECSVNNGGCQHYCRNTLGSYVCSCRNGYTLDENHRNCTETKCKFEIANYYGVIKSPNYPNDYPRNTYCFWHFRTVLGHRMQLTFHDFDVENHQECIYDYVAIYDGRSENGSTLGIYCGGQEPNAVISYTNEMFMVLNTDAGLQHKGFKATYSTVCGGYLRATNRTQIFYSHPRYGIRPYKRKMYCKWRIQADAESSVKITFPKFEIEYSDQCDYDSVEIMEEMSFSRNTNHGRFCGNQPPSPIVSYSDTIIIHFQTDESTSLRGFVISFVAVEPPEYDIDDRNVETITPFPGYKKSIYYYPNSD